MISLAEARKSGRIQEFVEQESGRGMDPVDRAQFDSAVEKLVRAPLPEGRHRVSHLAEIRAERELAEIPVQMLRTDMDMRSVH
jgi:hypothetical protein